MKPASSESAPETRGLRRFLRLRLSLAILTLGLLALLIAALPRWQAFAATTADWLDYPFMRAGTSEGLIQNETGLIQQNGPLAIYTPITPDRFISAPYTPLYYWANALVSPRPADFAARARRIVSEVQAKNVAPPTDSPFDGGRRISLVAALATALLLVLLVYFSGQRTVPALIGGVAAGGLWLSLPAVSIWATRVRADMLMTALQVAALVVVARWPHKWWVILFAAAPLFALALLTKQTALAGPLAACVWLAWRSLVAWVGTGNKSWRVFAPPLALLGGLALWLGLPLLVMDILSGNELWLRLVVYHALPWQSRNFGIYFDLFWHENLGLLLIGLPCAVIAVVWAVLALWRRNRAAELAQTVPALPALFLLASLPLLYGFGVAGADHNHFLPVETATCAAAGWAIAWLGGMGQVRRVAAYAALVTVLAVLVAQAAFFSVPQPYYSPELQVPNAKVQSQFKQILASAAAQPGPILSSEVGWNVLAGKDAAYNDLFTLNALAAKGTYDRSGLFAAIARGTFGVILTEGDLKQKARPDVWPPDLVSAILARYTIRYRDAWYTYMPK